MGRIVVGWMALALLVLNVPPATAFHGCAYRILGTAERADFPSSVPAELRWSGDPAVCGVGTEVFKVIIGASDPLHPDIIVAIEQATFAGREDTSSAHIEGCLEIIDPYWAWSVDPTVAFSVFGYQKLNLCNGIREMQYDGVFQDWTVHFSILSDLIPQG